MLGALALSPRVAVARDDLHKFSTGGNEIAREATAKPLSALFDACARNQDAVMPRRTRTR